MGRIARCAGGDVGYDQIGTVGGDSVKVGDVIDVKLSELREAYERDLFDAAGEIEVTH